MVMVAVGRMWQFGLRLVVDLTWPIFSNVASLWHFDLLFHQSSPRWISIRTQSCKVWTDNMQGDREADWG